MWAQPIRALHFISFLKMKGDFSDNFNMVLLSLFINIINLNIAFATEPKRSLTSWLTTSFTLNLPLKLWLKMQSF